MNKFLSGRRQRIRSLLCSQNTEHGASSSLGVHNSDCRIVFAPLNQVITNDCLTSLASQQSPTETCWCPILFGGAAQQCGSNQRNREMNKFWAATLRTQNQNSRCSWKSKDHDICPAKSLFVLSSCSKNSDTVLNCRLPPHGVLGHRATHWLTSECMPGCEWGGWGPTWLRVWWGGACWENEELLWSMGEKNWVACRTAWATVINNH